MLANSFSHGLAVLTKTCCECDHIYAVHRCCVSTDVLNNAVVVRRKSFRCAVVASLSCFLDVTEVAGYAGKAKNTRLLVQNVHNACDVKVLFLSDEFHDSRIHITGTCSHDKTLKRCKTHACIYGFAVLYSRKACAVSKMANDDL